eukprot:PhF_6_TR19572/c1_g1_i1/m.28533
MGAIVSLLVDLYHTVHHYFAYPRTTPPNPAVTIITDLSSGAFVTVPYSEYSFTPAPRKVRFVLISDTHDMHRRLSIPNGDVLIHLGDIVQQGRKFSQRNLLNKHKDFAQWFGDLPHPEKYIIGGNHDVYLEFLGKESCKEFFRSYSNATYIENDTFYTKKGSIRVFGSPSSAG